MIKIEVDTAQSIAGRFGLGDGHYENMKSLDPPDFVDDTIIVKTLIAHYRFNGRDNEFMIKDLQRSANEIGIVETHELWHTADHETVDRILDYLRKDAIAKAVQLSFAGRKDAVLSKNSRVNITVPKHGIDSDWQIVDYEILQGLYQLTVKRYLLSKYTYEASGSLPNDEDIDIDFAETPPNPLANVNLSYVTDFDEAGIVQTFAVLDYDIPEQAFFEARALIRKNGSTPWQSGGSSTDEQIRIPVTPGIAYDYQIAPYNANGINGIGQTFTNQLAPGDTTNPATPTGLTFVGAMLGLLTWEFDENTEEDLDGYEYEIDNNSNFLSPIKTGFTRTNKVEWPAQVGDLTSAQTVYCRVRAKDKTGNPTSSSVGWTTGVAGTTRDVDRDDMPSDTTQELEQTYGPGASPVSLTINVWADVISDSITFDESGTCKIRFSGQWEDTGGGFQYRLRRGTTTLFTSASIDSTGGNPLSFTHEDVDSAGTNTYTVQIRNTVQGGGGLGLTDRSLSLQVDYR